MNEITIFTSTKILFDPNHKSKIGCNIKPETKHITNNIKEITMVIKVNFLMSENFSLLTLEAMADQIGCCTTAPIRLMKNENIL